MQHSTSGLFINRKFNAIFVIDKEVKLLVNNIGKKIKQLRIAQKITQEQLAEELGVSIQQLHKYETGKNRIAVEKLIKLAKKFDVDLNYFADGIECKQNKKLPTPTLTPEEERVIKIYRNIQGDKLRESWLLIGMNLSK